MDWTTGALLSFLVVFIAYKSEWLTLDGAVAAFFVGCTTFGLGQWAFSIPLLTFFVTSNILTRVGRSQKASLSLHFQKTHKRNSAQVLSNGLMPTLMLVFWTLSDHPAFVTLFLTPLAAATADTWATEVGMLSKSTPRSIRSLRQVPPGSSGGISGPGLFSACLGAFVIAAIGLAILNQRLGSLLSLRTVLLIGVAGFVAQLFDSVLGATLQAKFRCPTCDSVTEIESHCGNAGSTLDSGFKWMTNDLVNFAAFYLVFYSRRFVLNFHTESVSIYES